MAHLRSIYVPDCQDSLCRSRATVTLYGLRNERYGDYCAKHGKAAEARLKRQEDADIARERDLEHGGIVRD